MSNAYKLSTFSKDRINELTMLYLQKSDISALTPEEFLDKYDEVYARLKSHYSETRSDRRHVGDSDF